MDIHGENRTGKGIVGFEERQIQEFVTALERHQTGLDANVEAIEKVLKELDRATDRINEEISLNEQTGWWNVDVILDELPAHQVRNALQQELSTGSFTSLLMSRLRENEYEQLQNLVDGWMKYSFLSGNRKAILKDAASAHREGKYTLSIPAILPQIEFFGKQVMIRNGQKLNALEAGMAENFYEHATGDYPAAIFFWDILLRNERKPSFPASTKLSDRANRHLVLHGKDDNYSTEELSVRVLLLMDKILRLRAKQI